MKQLLMYWKWFKSDRLAWMAAAASFVTWGAFSVIIAKNEWHIAGEGWVAMGAQMTCYVYIVFRYLDSRDQAHEQGRPGVASPMTVSASAKQARSEGWLFSREAIRLTPPVVALGGLVSVLGALGEFAPGVLTVLGGGFSREFISFALIAGPLWTLLGIRLMLAQSMHR